MDRMMKTLNEKLKGKTVSFNRIINYMSIKDFKCEANLGDLLVFSNDDFYYVYIFVEPKRNNEHRIKNAIWFEL